MTNRTSTRWVFTLNNYSEDDEQRIGDFLNGSEVRYGVYGREVASTGTPHLQGFLILHQACRLSYLRANFHQGAHYERARGSSRQASDYCKKELDFDEFGEFPAEQGKRSDLERLIDWIDDFALEHGRPPSSGDWAREQPVGYVRFPRLMELGFERHPRRPIVEGDLVEWQRQLGEILDGPSDDRIVNFVIDEEGGKGKTWFCRWMLVNKPEKTQVITVGRSHDIAHILDETKTIFLFNIPRGKMDRLNWSLIEGLKDGLVVSGKYNGRIKVWTQYVHVVVFGNEDPDMSRLSHDRYNFIRL